MPEYDYTCRRCGHAWSVEQRVTDPPRKYCPSCRRKAARRLISRTSFVLKGNRWARDRYG